VRGADDADRDLTPIGDEKCFDPTRHATILRPKAWRAADPPSPRLHCRHETP
jgi:hypothetical protein